jgi:hypothetical protein
MNRVTATGPVNGATRAIAMVVLPDRPCRTDSSAGVAVIVKRPWSRVTVSTTEAPRSAFPAALPMTVTV